MSRLKGSKLTLEHRKKLSLSKAGNKNPNYGFKYERNELRKYLLSNALKKAWKEGRMGISVFSRRGKDSINYKGGKPKCLHCGKENRSYSVTMHQECVSKYKGVGFYKKIGVKGLLTQQKMKEPTSIEKKLYKTLKENGLLFESQKLINGKFLVDAYIPSLNLVVEADGIYWHSLDRVVKKDRAENAYLKKCGYNILRFTENEINRGDFIERIMVN